MVETNGLENEKTYTTIENLQDKISKLELQRERLKDILISDMSDEWKLQAIKANI
jgi:hypothetical protein